jgi:nucleoside-diphosphate-sugar epimerase
MRIVITGATGLLGRNLLFEILKQNLDDLHNLEIIVLGRSDESISLQQRLDKILDLDGLSYIGLTRTQALQIEKIKNALIPIAFDLSKERVGISTEDIKILKTKPIDHLFHIAALTSFRQDKIIEKHLNKINVVGTKHLCELFAEMQIGNAAFIGSAYSCGDKTGVVEPDYVNLNEIFRNPYEKSKLESEVYFKKFFSNRHIPVRIFRPTGICGRLIEPPLGAIPKFDIFYGWAAFFLKQKAKRVKSPSKIYDPPYNLPVRVRVNLNAGMNLVPADYAAKVMYLVCFSGAPAGSYHLVNDIDIPYEVSVEEMMKCLNLEGYSLVENDPKDKSKFEQLYYKTAGLVFTPYAIMGETIFSTKNLMVLLAKAELKCPPMDRKNFAILLQYAKNKDFGLDLSNLSGKE